MLKRLDLIGFKSFADKTTFEFGPGITAIVGPNGSGKSNIVDGVRWILGEQSAKSLRGGEMTDVIFNGSASRRSFGMAEVTLTMDNSRGVLATEAQEVQITRRVYRSGEGEYLINQQPCRLKDIKDLFLGSGAGTDAYCIIAQGKVDVLLQASTKERRSIFEEAAGISRFKAKKIETLRKLERVDQNVQRLKDIIDEVEKQLRSVKLQAGKAQRYQEHSGRLKELRLGLGLQEYQQLTGQLETEITFLEGLRGQLEQRGTQVRDWEEQHQNLEQSLTLLEGEIHEQEATVAQAGQQIRAQETTLGHEATLTQDLQLELNRLRQQTNEMTVHMVTLAASLSQAEQELRQADADSRQQQETVQRLEQNVQEIEESLGQLGEKLQTGKANHLDQMRQTARLQNDAVTYKAQIDNFSRELSRLRQKSEQAAETLASLDHEMRELSGAETGLQTRLGQARRLLAAGREDGEKLRRSRDETVESVSDLRQQRSGLSSRIEVLEGLERSHEGLGTGVGEVLDLLEKSRRPDQIDSPWNRCVVGMLADFLTVRREYAPLIDLALGDWSQRFLVRDVDLLGQALAQCAQAFSSRVSFLPLNRHQETGSSDESAHPNQRLVDISPVNRSPIPADPALNHSGIIARADQVVRCDDPELGSLPAQLLGRTLIVRDLGAARALAAHGRDFRFITLQGELLEADGTLTVGTHHADTGILSRKSELREIRDQISVLDHRIAEAERDLVELRERVAISDSRVQQHQQEIQVLSEQAADLRSRLEMHRDRRQGLHEEVSVSRDEILRAEKEVSSLRQSWQVAEDQAASAEANVLALQTWIEQAEAQSRQLEQVRQQRHQQWTAAKVALAKAEERLAGLRNRHQLLSTDAQQRQQELTQGRDNLRLYQQRLEDSQQTMLLASAALATWYTVKESSERRISQRRGERDQCRLEKNQLAERLQSVRGEWQSHQERLHGHELKANDLRHKRDTLTSRLREDYQIELADVYQLSLQAGQAADAASRASDDGLVTLAVQIPPDLSAANEEIEELRRKLNRLGSVNLDSLRELADLEIRATTLNAQYDDLTAAKRALEEIINKINLDSRRLFSEAFVTIRGHFQELFRKLFGGGMADAVLEDEKDILESGIEIIARPPGKELRSISLMSGGEKTLTAVALLLAIFRSRPSPFCILDEVDAALDEANIGRFADVLREFLDQSHFIIITHSKRTMSTADVIYGITMQESGISKRVSVRFDDWEKFTEPPLEEKQEVA